MRILWALSNWKRTGPVEPSLDLAAALARRGHEALVVTGRPIGTADDEAAEAAEARGLTRLDLRLRLAKHLSFLGNRRDAARLASHLRAHRPDVVVSTLRNDHRVLARAVALSGAAIPLVRLWFEDGSARIGRPETKRLRGAARVVTFGSAPEASLLAVGVAKDRLARALPPLDLARIRRAATRREEMRRRFAGGSDAVLVGVVARVQAHRRFEVLWQAAERLVRDGVPFRLLVIGRGTRLAEIASGPVARRGLSGHVTLTGYLRGEEYASTLATLDVQAFLVPGSDPTCRALREGMALGVPSVATRRGLLPDIVADGETGLLVEETPEALAAALARLCSDPALRARLSAAAAARADAQFSLPAAAESMERILVEALR